MSGVNTVISPAEPSLSAWAVDSPGAQVAAVAVKETRLLLSNFPELQYLYYPSLEQKEPSQQLLVQKT